jgi:ribosomal protein S18 acetylase RimI-like enzyme
MFELEAVAAGTWYLQVVGLFAEYRGMGLGQRLLDQADSLARQAGLSRITLITESFNARAIAAYLRHGYREWDRRTFIPFAGTDEEGDWMLMVKDL